MLKMFKRKEHKLRFMLNSMMKRMLKLVLRDLRIVGLMVNLFMRNCHLWLTFVRLAVDRLVILF